MKKLTKIIIGAATLSCSMLAMAWPAYETTVVYYSDATHTEVVGEKLKTSCFGIVNQMIWGTTSGYSVNENILCDRPTTPRF